MKYQVSLPGRPPGTVAATARAMAEAFRMSESKATALLERTPGPLTKPIGEREAVRVAFKLRKLGLAVEIKQVSTEASVGSSASGAAKSASSGSSPQGSTSTGGSFAGSPPATSGTPRSPFLSQVDEAPPRIPGLDDEPVRTGPAPGVEPSAPLHGSRSEDDGPDVSTEDSESVPPRADAAEQVQGPSGPAARPPAPYAPTGVGALPRRGAVASPFRRRLVFAALLPGLVALIGAWLAFSWVDGGVDDGVLAGVAASHAESFVVLLGGRDPAGVGARGELREALLGARSVLEAQGVAAVTVTDVDGGILAGWPTDLDAGSLGPGRPGWDGLVARAGRSSGAVFGHVGEQGWRAVATPVRVRGEPVAIAVVLGESGPPLGRAGIALGVGVVALLVAVAAAWWANRGWMRDHDRLLEETVRISRGDLGRPVEASARFPEAVQALERIRVSLLEGLERLRRRMR